MKLESLAIAVEFSKINSKKKEGAKQESETLNSPLDASLPFLPTATIDVHFISRPSSVQPNPLRLSLANTLETEKKSTSPSPLARKRRSRFVVHNRLDEFEWEGKEEVEELEAVENSAGEEENLDESPGRCRRRRERRRRVRIQTKPTLSPPSLNPTPLGSFVNKYTSSTLASKQLSYRTEVSSRRTRGTRNMSVVKSTR